jgi:hypothetical protein
LTATANWASRPSGRTVQQYSKLLLDQQLDKSFFGTLPGLFGLFSDLFFAYLEAFLGLQVTSAFLRPFQGFRGFGLFVFSGASCGFPLSIDFFFVLSPKEANDVQKMMVAAVLL